ncbi:MAG: type II toxin-antitoxin system RelE/ParE family toxin [Acidobacteriota bacterium]
MPAPTYRFHPDAVREAEGARDWYAERSLRAAAGFLEELDRGIVSVVEAPERWPQYLHGARRYVLQRFPFLVVYRVVNEVVEIIAVAHGRRRPGYWKKR